MNIENHWINPKQSPQARATRSICVRTVWAGDCLVGHINFEPLQEGFIFCPNVSGRKRSTKAHFRAENSIPRWATKLDLTIIKNAEILAHHTTPERKKKMIITQMKAGLIRDLIIKGETVDLEFKGHSFTITLNKKWGGDFHLTETATGAVFDSDSLEWIKDMMRLCVDVAKEEAADAAEATPSEVEVIQVPPTPAEKDNSASLKKVDELFQTHQDHLASGFHNMLWQILVNKSCTGGLVKMADGEVVVIQASGGFVPTHCFFKPGQNEKAILQHLNHVMFSLDDAGVQALLLESLNGGDTLKDNTAGEL